MLVITTHNAGVKQIILLLIVLFFARPILQAKDSTFSYVSPADPNIHYEGRIDKSNAQKYLFSYPGVIVSATFEGTFIEVLLQDLGAGGEQNTNYFTLIIDHGNPTVLELKGAKKNHRVAENLKDTVHHIFLMKRTESSVGTVAFSGFQLQRGKKLQPNPATTTVRRIEFIGDSFTAAYGNEVSIGPPPDANPNTGFHSINENNYSSWGAITCRTLNAEYMCTAYSGRGLMRNNTGSTSGTLPLIYDQIIADDAGTTWKHEQWHPDVIIIALGQNDFFTGVPDSNSFVRTYIDFVTHLRELHPAAKIVCVAGNGMSDWWPEGEFRWTHKQNYVKAVVNHCIANGDKQVHYLMLTPQLPPYGEDWHPANHTHSKMASTAVNFIKSITGWE